MNDISNCFDYEVMNDISNCFNIIKHEIEFKMNHHTSEQLEILPSDNDIKEILQFDKESLELCTRDIVVFLL